MEAPPASLVVAAAAAVLAVVSCPAGALLSPKGVSNEGIYSKELLEPQLEVVCFFLLASTYELRVSVCTMCVSILSLVNSCSMVKLLL